MTNHPFSLPKAEHLCGMKLIDRLFNSGMSKSLSAYPIRLVYMIGEREADDTTSPVAQMMVSVPKRYFKRAVKRNRIKRQVREAYRLNKHIVTEPLKACGNKNVYVCFVWSADQLLDSNIVQAKMKGLLNRLAERL